MSTKISDIILNGEDMKTQLGVWFRTHKFWFSETPYVTQRDDQWVNHSAITYPSKMILNQQQTKGITCRWRHQMEIFLA